MRLCLISTGDLHNGATLAAYRLHRALGAAGHQSTLLVTERLSDDPGTFETDPEPDSLPARAWRKISVRLEHAASRFLPQGGFTAVGRQVHRHPAVLAADVVHVHNLHQVRFGFPLAALGRIAAVKPVLWTLHDMWPLTGHCIYSMDCDRWLAGCGRCPDLRRHMPIGRDTTAAAMRWKRRLYADARFDVAAPSDWLAGLARRSPLLHGHRIHRLRNALDPECFAAPSRTAARAALGLPDEAPIILYASNFLDNAFKGAAAAAEAIRLAVQGLPGARLVIMGNGRPPPALRAAAPCLQVGHLASERLKSLVYAAADVLLHPSLADNLPNTVLEAMAAGCPCVGFSNGGLTELVTGDELGRLVPSGDVPALAQALVSVALRSGDAHAACRAQALAIAAPDAAAQAHLAVYADLAAQGPG